MEFDSRAFDSTDRKVVEIGTVKQRLPEMTVCTPKTCVITAILFSNDLSRIFHCVQEIPELSHLQNTKCTSVVFCDLKYSKCSYAIKSDNIVKLISDVKFQCNVCGRDLIF